ncbi:MAG: hypothetical protein ACR2GU_12565 [Rubrobacteraceae bacterium]
MTPEAKATLPETASAVEVRITGGIYALNRFLMTLQSKRIPVAGLTVGGNTGAMLVTVLIDCPPDTARRYATLLGALENVEELRTADETLGVALLKPEGEGWRESASRAGIGTHEDGDIVVASGPPETLESWLSRMESGEITRLGTVARPGEEV